MWATVSSRSCFCWLYSFSIFGYEEWNQSDFSIDHLVMSICTVFSWVVERVFAMTSVLSWQNSVSLCPASFCTPRPNLPVTPSISWLPTFAFQTLMINVIVVQSCLSLCNPMDCSTSGLPVHHHLSEFPQTHVHWVIGAIQPSDSLSVPSPPAFNLSQHQGLFQWVRWPKYWIFRCTGVSASASVLPMNIQNWFLLGWTGWISLQSKGLLRVFANTTVRKHQFFSAQLYSSTLTSIHDYWKNHSFDLYGP